MLLHRLSPLLQIILKYRAEMLPYPFAHDSRRLLRVQGARTTRIFSKLAVLVREVVVAGSQPNEASMTETFCLIKHYSGSIQIQSALQRGLQAWPSPCHACIYGSSSLSRPEAGKCNRSRCLVFVGVGRPDHAHRPHAYTSRCTGVIWDQSQFSEGRHYSNYSKYCNR